MKKFGFSAKRLLLGAIIGTFNGLFGAGGGILCVPVLIKEGFDRKTAHKNTVAVILPITVASAVLYIIFGRVTIAEGLKYVPGGIIGSFIGTYIMSKIKPKWIRRIFGGFMVWAGWRLMF